MNEFLVVGVLMLWAGQVETGEVESGQVESGPEEKAQSADRLKFMKDKAERFTFLTNGAKPKNLELAPQPVLRWANPDSFVVDGATFLWLSEKRPEVIGAMWFELGRAHFELHSLSSEPLAVAFDGDPRWSISQPGIRWEAVPAAPPPAETRAERLRQLKRLAEDFSMYAVKAPPRFEAGSTWRYRMLAQPIYRYAEEAAVDGAIFALVQGTDPEAFLLLESRPAEGKPGWHFAFAAACGWELHGQHRQREVWFVKNWHEQDDRDRVYNFVGPWPVDPKLLPSKK
jgi:hypothetical protein